jgi:hypothetical protein
VQLHIGDLEIVRSRQLDIGSDGSSIHFESCTKLSAVELENSDADPPTIEGSYRGLFYRGLFAPGEAACPASGRRGSGLERHSTSTALQYDNIIAATHNAGFGILFFPPIPNWIASRMDRDHSARHWHRPGGCQPRQTSEWSP